MECSKTCVVIFTALILSTAGFVLTLTGWFAPPMNSFVDGVRLAGPLTLLIGSIMLIFSCVLCAFVQGKCCDCCYIFKSHKQAMLDIERMCRPDTHRSPLILHDMPEAMEANKSPYNQNSMGNNGVNACHSSQKHLMENGAVPQHLADRKLQREEESRQNHTFLKEPASTYPSIFPSPKSCPSSPQKLHPPPKKGMQQESTSCPSSPKATSAYELTKNSSSQSSLESDFKDVWVPKQPSPMPRQAFAPIVPPLPPVRSDSQKRHESYSPRVMSRQRVRPVSDCTPVKDKMFMSTGLPTFKDHTPSPVIARLKKKHETNLDKVHSENRKSPCGGRDSFGNRSPLVMLKKDTAESTVAHQDPSASVVPDIGKKMAPPTYQDVMHKRGVYDVTV